MLHRVSSQNQGMHRVKIPSMLRMRVNDVFTLVVPPTDNTQPTAAIPPRLAMLSNFGRIIVSAAPSNLNKSQRDSYVSVEFNKRTFSQEGMNHIEFNVRVASYPERHILAQLNPLPADLNHMLGVGNAGLYLDLKGYGTGRGVLLRLSDLPYFQVFVMRDPGAPFLDPSFEFPYRQKEQTLGRKLAEELYQSKGDTVSTVQIMMNYYKTTSHRAASAEKKGSSSEFSIIKAETLLQKQLVDELSGDNLEKYSNAVDTKYQSEMSDRLSDWWKASSYLTSDPDIAVFYNDLKEQFPMCHFVFACAVSTRSYQVSTWSVLQPREEEDEGEQLHRKQRMILYVFFGLLRTRNRNLLLHYSMVEPLANWFKGLQQPGRRSISGGFNSDLRRTWKRLGEMYDQCIPTFNEKLQSTERCHGALDNHNKIIRSKFMTEGKSAIVHIGTAMFLRQDKPYYLPVGTKMISPMGISFNVIECTRHSDTQLKLTGNVCPQYLLRISLSPIWSTRNLQHEIVRILDGFLYPEIGWVIAPNGVPGQSPMPEVTYRRQTVPPPMKAWVNGNATSQDILLGDSRPFSTSADPTAITLTSARMHGLHCQAQRIQDMQTMAKYFERKRHELLEEGTDALSASLRDQSSSVFAFIQSMNGSSLELCRARVFESDLVTHVNSRWRKVDLMFAWGVTPYSETSHEGMKKVFYKLGVNFQMFSVDEEKQMCHLLPNALRRRIHLVVDALTSRNFRCLKMNLSKKLTELGNADMILPMLECLSRFTCTHDYLHETRMHRSDAIYRSHFGGYLQPMACHLQLKRITGDPGSRNVQGHEQFLFMAQIAHSRVRFETYLEQRDESIITPLITESRADHLMRMDADFTAWCDEFNEGLDEPTIAANLFIKYVESYRRCYNGAKNGNTWLMDIEGYHWLGGYKITGKTNYVTETCHRMDVLFGGGLTPDELEWRRLNQVFVMTHGGHTMTLDELNELLNWWNKGIVTSPDFETVCNQTRFVSITRGCMHDTFGPGNRKSKKPSVEKDIECLMDLLRNANLWSPNRTEKRELYGDFYWDLHRPRENVGSEKSKKKESVCESTQVQRLFDILCSTDEQRDFDEFEVNEEGDDDATICCEQHHG